MKLVTVLGARPQFVKAAPVSRALREQCLQEVTIHTGQHFDPEMSDIFFSELDLPPPAHHLGIHGGGHGEMTGRMLIAVEQVLLAERPDAVLVYGDTNSTLAGALGAAKLQIPVVHVEAGLRSFNRMMPEETNRIVADHVSTQLFCPTLTAVENLRREGVTGGVHHVGDVMYDAVLLFRELAARRSDVLRRLGLKPGCYTVATLHRAENTNSRERLAGFLRLLRKEPLQPVVMPLHPRTREAIRQLGLEFDGLNVIAPVGYLDMLMLLENCDTVYTDSGGMQKEAYFLRRPCVTLRDETEWVETITHGWNRLWNVADFRIRREIADFGDGMAAMKIAQILAAGSVRPPKAETP